MKPNPWLEHSIAELYDHRAEEGLRAQYDSSRQADQNLDWEDFLWDKALLYQLELHPELKTRADEMPFRQHTKDVLKANYLDALVMLVQMTVSELRRIPGLSTEELQEIITYLGTRGLSLEEGGEPTVKQAWDECFNERQELFAIMNSLKEARKAVGEEKGLSYNGMVEKEVELFEDADAQLSEHNADKGTKQRFLWEYANFLHDHMSTCPKETEGALRIAQRELGLREYLYGPEHKLTGESLELVGEIHQELLDYPGAIPYYTRAVAITEREEGEHSHHLADLYQALGISLLENKDFDAAISSLNRAYEGYFNQPKGPERKTLGHLCFLIADAYREKGDMKRFSEYVDRGKLFLE